MNTDFLKVDKSDILKIKSSANTMLFGNSKKDYNVYMGLSKGGAYKKPENSDRIQFIFIFTVPSGNFPFENLMSVSFTRRFASSVNIVCLN